MFLSQSLQANAARLADIKGSMVVLLTVLQLAAWYPFISQAQEATDRRLMQKSRTLLEWKQIELQSERIIQASFPSVPWGVRNTASKTNLMPTQLELKGTASTMEWQTWLERIEALFPLGLMSASWQLSPNGKWIGRLLFDIKAPKKNREYHNWLPTKLRAEHFAAEDWRLLSIMKVGETASALIEHKQRRHWVRQGSWLPSAGVSVHDVSFDQVTFMSKDGTQVALIVHDVGESNE